MFIKSVSPFTEEGFEKSHFFEQKVFYGIFSEPTRKIVVLWHWNSSQLSKLSFISCGNFRENFVFGENINRSIACLRFQGEFFFCNLKENQAFGRKVSARLPKLDSTLPNCSIKENFFFGWMNVSKLFFKLVADFFSDSCKKHQKIVKLLFLSV